MMRDLSRSRINACQANGTLVHDLNGTRTLTRTDASVLTIIRSSSSARFVTGLDPAKTCLT